jgi:hypothetical protein
VDAAIARSVILEAPARRGEDLSEARIDLLLRFVTLPWLIRRGWSFYPALAVAIGCTTLGYGLVSVVLKRIGG